MSSIFLVTAAVASRFCSVKLGSIPRKFNMVKIRLTMADLVIAQNVMFGLDQFLRVKFTQCLVLKMIKI